MIGIIPAAGQASRMMGLPKMLLPIPTVSGTLINELIDRMAVHTNEIIVSTRGEIAPLLAGSWRWKPDEVRHVSTKTMSETVLLSRSHGLPDDWTAFGMPDSYFEDKTAFSKLHAALKAGADVAVGLFATRPEQRGKLGMVRADGCQVVAVVDKPHSTDLTYAWGVLAWKPVFWEYIRADDPHVGYALPRAIDAGLDLRPVYLDGGYWDCGTPNEYFDLICHLRGTT